MGHINIKAYVRAFETLSEQVCLWKEAKQGLQTGGLEVRMRLSPVVPSDFISIYGRYAHRVTLPFAPGAHDSAAAEK